MTRSLSARVLYAASWIALIVALWAPVQRGAAQGQLVLKLATSFGQHSPWGQALERFATHVRTGSHGKIQVRIFFDGALGPDVEQVERVALGTLQAFAGPIETMTQRASWLRALETPGLFASPADASRKLTRSKERIAALLSTAGLRLGMWQHAGFRSRFVLRGTEAPQVMTPIVAFASGQVLRTERVTLTRESLAAGALVYSQRWFDGLPAQTKAQLDALPATITEAMNAELSATETRLIAAIRERGIAVDEASNMRQELRATTDTYVTTLDENGRALYRQLAAP